MTARPYYLLLIQEYACPVSVGWRKWTRRSDLMVRCEPGALPLRYTVGRDGYHPGLFIETGWTP